MLSVKRPTQSTVLYTVSTRSPIKAITDQILRYALVLIRLLIGYIVALALLIKYESTYGSLVHTEPSLSSRLHVNQHFFVFITGTSWYWLLPISGVLTWLILRKGYTEESLLIIRGLGVQTSSSSASYLSTASTRFIPTNAIQDIFIHEAFRGFEVKFYLAIVVEGETDVVVVFPNILPNRQTLEEVWRGAKSCLYGPKT